MGKCLVTKLAGSSNNKELLRLGELQIKIGDVTNPSKTTNGIRLICIKDVKLEIIGDGYFTDINFSENKGKVMNISAGIQNDVFYSNGNYIISILDKYSIKSISTYAIQAGLKFAGKLSLDIKNLEYCVNLEGITLTDTQTTGDIAALKNLTKLKYITCNNTQITGDIGALKNLTNIIEIGLTGSELSGDIAALKNLTKLTFVSFQYNTNIFGDIAALNNLTKLTHIALRDTKTTGDISVFSNMTELQTCQLNGVSGDISALRNTKVTALTLSNSRGLTGDISKLPSNFINLDLNEPTSLSRFTWSSRDTNSTIFSNSGNPYLTTSLDDMLINMSQCRNTSTSGVISYNGSRTSASDTAVERLQQYGYTIRITKA